MDSGFIDKEFRESFFGFAWKCQKCVCVAPHVNKYAQSREFGQKHNIKDKRNKKGNAQVATNLNLNNLA